MKNKTNHPWHNTPMWKRRLNGFASYFMFALFSIYDPIAADKIMYTELKEQLGDK